MYNFRHRRDTFTHEAIMYFDFVLTGVYNPDQTAAEMDSNSYSQFNALTNRFKEIIDDGGLDITGLEIQTDSFRTNDETLIVCETGEIAEYSRFTCRKYGVIAKTYIFLAFVYNKVLVFVIALRITRLKVVPENGWCNKTVLIFIVLYKPLNHGRPQKVFQRGEGQTNQHSKR